MLDLYFFYNIIHDSFGINPQTLSDRPIQNSQTYFIKRFNKLLGCVIYKQKMAKSSLHNVKTFLLDII